jgi:chaperonin GroES
MASESKTGTVSKMTVRPLDDRVLVRPDEAEERTKGGIVLPDTAKEKPARGQVIAVGPGKLLENGSRVPPGVKVGDRVIYGKYSGSEVKIQDVAHSILRESEILAVLD